MKTPIETIFAKDFNSTLGKKPCSTCKTKRFNKYFISIFAVSTYLFATSIYGSYILFQKLFSAIFE